MTIEIPEHLARSLEGLAAAENKSVEQLALERLQSLIEIALRLKPSCERFGNLPHPSCSAVDELDAAIGDGRLPVRDQGVFDGRSRG
jgi:hypothetical protein